MLLWLQLLYVFYYDAGYGYMTHQLQHQEMQPSTVGQRSCRLSGIVNQTAWYGILHHMNMSVFFSCWKMMLIVEN